MDYEKRDTVNHHDVTKNPPPTLRRSSHAQIPHTSAGTLRFPFLRYYWEN